MKVMLLHHRSDFLGGAERSLVELSRALGQAGVEVSCAAPAGALSEELAAAGARVFHIPAFLPRRSVSPFGLVTVFFGRWRATAALGAILRDAPPDIVHANSLPSQLVSAALPGRWKRVWHARDVPRTSSLARRLARGADAVICVSEFVRSRLAEAGVEQAKLRLVMNGIDLSPFERLPSRDEARARLGLAREGFVAGCVSSLVPWKKVGLFVEGVELAREEVEMRAVVVGGVPPGARAERLPERPWLVPTGWREDVPDILPAFDVFCAPSEGEPFGRNVVEAMAAGLSVVASDSGAHGEVIEDGASGLLFPAGDARALAALLVKLALDENLRATLARGAKERAKAFSVERAAGEILRLYRGV